jgi:hypothetical protein
MREFLHKLWAGLALLASAWTLAACGTASAGAYRAGLVVVHGDGTVQTACVDFSQTQISGLELLDRSGLDYRLDASNPMGALVCRVGPEGCDYPAQTCLCQCSLGQACRYWAYFNRPAGSNWVYAVSGTSSRPVHDGDVDAWVWLAGDETTRTVPPGLTNISFNEVCGTVPSGADLSP